MAATTVINTMLDGAKMKKVGGWAVTVSLGSVSGSDVIFGRKDCCVLASAWSPALAITSACSLQQPGLDQR